MRRVCITPAALNAQRDWLDEVTLVQVNGAWVISVWLRTADAEMGKYGATEGYHLSSGRNPTEARVFKTADAAINVLWDLGISRVQFLADRVRPGAPK